jgi:endonuclease/exonuclease/phosphatase family metal-dependent hydrolase
MKPSPGKERMVKDARELSPEELRVLVGQRYRRRVNPLAPPVRDEAMRREMEMQIDQLEKIHQKADFLPVGFLRLGVERSRAVCRVVTAGGLGTGFLVGRGVLMTNNHVLETADQAAEAVAEFDFEDGTTTVAVRLAPDQLFLTDVDLDFTLVACDDAPIAGVPPIPLSRDPASIMHNERVSIIQHPAGRRKEIALHENEVTKVMDKVIHYRTDTEPGSSGSPVFNNRWQLVALHHAGWNEPGGSATNEGVRISTIVARLRQLQFGGLHDGERLGALLEGAGPASPFLGFFDTSGLGPDGREVQVDTFAGNREFADVGVWNIEHFNGSVADGRVGRVADVLAGLAMDAMGLTEVEKGALDRLVVELGERGFSYDYKLLDVGGRQDLAVLFDQETTRVRVRTDLAQRYQDQLKSKTRTGQTAFPRPPLFAECTVSDPDGGRRVEFLLLVVHLKAFGDAVSKARRRLAAEKLAEIIADLRDHAGLPVVLGGDFNDTLNVDTFDALKTSPDLFTMTLDDAADPTAMSFVGPRHRSLIDHLVVSRDVVPGDIQGDDAAIVRLDRSIPDFADAVSDHVPVVFRMVFRSQEVVLAPADGVAAAAAPAAGEWSARPTVRTAPVRVRKPRNAGSLT